MSIHACAHQMVMLARQLNLIVQCKFNEVELIAYPQHISGDALAVAYEAAARGEVPRGSYRVAFSDGKHVP